MDFVCGSIYFDLDNRVFQIYDSTVSFDNIRVVWHRKFGFYRSTNHYKEILSNYGDDIAEQTLLEINSIKDYFISLCSRAYFVGNPKRYRTNKLVELTTALEVGFDVPKTFLVSNARQLGEIPYKFITKSVYNAQTIALQNDTFTMLTSSVSSSLVSALSGASFFPSLVQEKIEKKYELRVFYILGEIYCMAILSQSNQKTMADFRHYDFTKPNRFLPFKLDADVERKIVLFMEAMELNTGSLDFIIDVNDRIIFLEVNSEGQFGMVDFPCNYGIHKRIAEILIDKDK